jgi:hypothetical protein
MSARGWHNWAFALSACALTLELYGLTKLVFG